MTNDNKSNDGVRSEPRWVRWLLIGITTIFLGLFVAIPVATIFSRALAKGIGAYVDALGEPDALAAIRLTLVVAAISVPINTVFGVIAAWLIAKYRFRGRDLLVALIDLPFSVSPIVAGLVFVLLFGQNGFLGPLLLAHDVKIVFALPGIVIATIFITFPFVAREVLPVLQAQGTNDEEASLTLGANGWQMFWRITFPKIKWALLAGVILCNARAMGEFGAVSVVSGHVRGLTNTMPLHAEILYNEYDFVGAFAISSLLTLLALITLFVKKLVDWRSSGP